MIIPFLTHNYLLINLPELSWLQPDKMHYSS